MTRHPGHDCHWFQDGRCTLAEQITARLAPEAGGPIPVPAQKCARCRTTFGELVTRTRPLAVVANLVAQQVRRHAPDRYTAVLNDLRPQFATSRSGGAPLALDPRTSVPETGVGTQLSRILRSRYNVSAADCESGCSRRIATMNKWGPAGCREQRETIVKWLIRASEQKWKTTHLIPDAVKRPQFRELVDEAIAAEESRLQGLIDEALQTIPPDLWPDPLLEEADALALFAEMWNR